MKKRRGLGAFGPVCTVRLLVGGGIAARGSKGRRVTADPERLSRRVQELASIYFPASTHIKARGFWEGVGEPSIMVDLIQAGPAPCKVFFERARCAARAIARELEQDAVGVLVRDSTGKSDIDFVERKGGDVGTCRLNPSETKAARTRVEAIRKLL